MELMAQILWTLLITTVILFQQTTAQTTDRYTDENRPYEFGFVIEGQQHRHEKKDEAGIITGEFGFVTADGIYHVTVYATDENGDFKILSMKNVRVAPSPFGNPAAKTSSFPPATGVGVTTSAPAPASFRTSAFKTDTTRAPVYQQPSTPATVTTTTKKTFKLHNGCSNCLIPTTTTTTTQPPIIENQKNRPPPLPSKPGFPFSSSFPNPPTVNQPSGSRSFGGERPSTGPQSIDTGRNFGTISSNTPGGQQPSINSGTIPRNQDGPRSKPPAELQPPFTPDQETLFPRTGDITPGSVFQSKSTFDESSTPNSRPSQSSFGQPPAPIPRGDVSTTGNFQPQFPNTNISPGPSQPFSGNNNGVGVPPLSPNNPQLQTPSVPRISPSTSGGPLSSSPQNPNQRGPGSSSPRLSNSPQTQTPNVPRISPATSGSLLPSSPQNPNLGGPGSPSPRNQPPNVPGAVPLSLERATPSPLGVERDGPPPGVSVSDVMNLLYIFNYTVGFHGHHESGFTNGDKEGGYFVNGRDGISRNVNYIANEFGYQPNVTLVNLGLNSPDTPKEETEKEFGLKGYEFKWYSS